MRQKNGVSEVVGSLLMLVVVAITVSVLVAYGIPTIYSNQEHIRMRNAAAMMVSFSELVSKVSSDLLPTASMKFALSGGSLLVSPNEEIIVYVNNSTSNIYYTIINKIVEYKYDNKKICFDGGVWVKDSSGSYNINPPKIKVKGKNISVTLYKFPGNSSVSGRGFVNVEIKYNSSETRIFNESGYIEMEIYSDYVEAWKKWLEEEGFTVAESNGKIKARTNFSFLRLSIYTVDVEMRI